MATKEFLVPFVIPREPSRLRGLSVVVVVGRIVRSDRPS
jgi:hypothetical protein